MKEKINIWIKDGLRFVKYLEHLKAIKKAKEEVIKDILDWIYENALCQTTYDESYWDDGDVMFKRNDKKLDCWSDKHWKDLLDNFSQDYINYDELTSFLQKLKEGK